MDTIIKKSSYCALYLRVLSNKIIDFDIRYHLTGHRHKRPCHPVMVEYHPLRALVG